MNLIRVVNRSRGTLLGNRIQLVDSWPGRLRGYLGHQEPQPGEGMLLVSCNAVHMFGLDFPLDLIFLNKDGEVVETIVDLRPWRRTSRIDSARFALEVPTGSIEASYTRPGDRFAWTCPEPVYSPSQRMEGLWRFDPGAQLNSAQEGEG